MPLSLYQIANNTAKINVHIPGSGDFSLEYYPGRVTEETFGHLKKFDHMSEGDIISSFESLNEVLSTLIKSWDLYEDVEQTIPYPIDTQKLKKLPISFRVIVLQCIMNDIRPETIAPQTES